MKKKEKRKKNTTKKSSVSLCAQRYIIYKKTKETKARKKKTKLLQWKTYALKKM